MTNETIQEHIQEVENHVEKAGFSEVKFDTSHTIIESSLRDDMTKPSLHVKAEITEEKELTNFYCIQEAFNISVENGNLVLKWSFELPEDFLE